MRRNLYQRAHHEVAQVHQRVGQVQMGSVNRDRSAVCGVTEQQVDVNDAVVIDAVHRFGRTPHLAFYGLCGFQYLQGLKRRADLADCVQEAVGRVESPGGSSIKSGQGGDSPYPLFYFLHGIAEVLLLVAEISAQT